MGRGELEDRSQAGSSDARVVCGARIAGELFSEQARGGYDIFAQASHAVNGDVIVVQPEQPTMATGGEDAQGADQLQEKAKQVGALVGKGMKLGVKVAQEQLQGVSAACVRTNPHAFR